MKQRYILTLGNIGLKIKDAAGVNLAEIYHCETDIDGWVKILRGKWKSAGNTELRIHKKLVDSKTPTYLCLPHYNLVFTECNKMKDSSPMISVFTLCIQLQGVSPKGLNTPSYNVNFDFFSINLHDHHHCVLHRIESESQV